MRPAISSLLSLGAVVLATILPACASKDTAATDDADITSAHATILDFTFRGELIAGEGVAARGAIVSQLMYTQGILTTAKNGNGQVGNVTLSAIKETRAGGKRRIAYEATLPVAWPKGLEAPKDYDLPLPLDATAFDAFNAKYDGMCGKNEYGVETFWHDFDPMAPGCTLDARDFSRTRAAVAPHVKPMKEAYPEYEAIWADDRLDVVAVFGVITSRSPIDYGFTELRKLEAYVAAELTDVQRVQNAESASIFYDETITGKVMVGGRERTVKVDLLLADELTKVGADFDDRYDALTEQADLVLYNGHAGLGRNVNALARKGRVPKSKYQIVMMNGCQSFAYLDTTLTDRRIEANGAANDPRGTKYLDVVGNAMPGWASELANFSSILYRGVIHADEKPSYATLLGYVNPDHIAVVFGEEDNP